MRGLLVWVWVLALAGPAMADVRLLIRQDGSKVIYNVESRRSSRGSDLQWLAKQRNRPSIYDPIIERHCRRYGVDPVLARAVIQVESNFNPAVVSHKGARGLMQLMPETAKRFKVAKIIDPEENIRGGIEYLSVLLKLFPNDLSRVLAGYNAGENAVLRYRGIPPYEETQTYVRRALTVFYGRPHGSIGLTVKNLGGRKLKGTLQRRSSAPLIFASTVARPMLTSPGPTAKR